MYYSVKNDRLVIEIELHSENDIYDWFLQTDVPMKLSDIERLKTEYKNQKSKPTIHSIDFEKPKENNDNAYNDIYHWLVKSGYSSGSDTEQLSVVLKKFFDAKKDDIIETEQLYRMITIFDAFGLDKNVKIVNVIPNKDVGSLRIIKVFPALKDIKPAEFSDTNDDLFGNDPSILTNPNGLGDIVVQEDTAS